MLRKVAIGLAAVAIAMGGATLSVSARGGGHGGGFARMGGGFGHHHEDWRGQDRSLRLIRGL
jgi:hypothetical protein